MECTLLASSWLRKRTCTSWNLRPLWMKVRVCYSLQSIKLLVTFRFMGVFLKLVISFSLNNSSGNTCGEQNYRISCDRRRLEVGKYALFCTQFLRLVRELNLKLFMEFDLRMHFSIQFLCLWGNLCCCRLGLFQTMTCWLWTPYRVIGPATPLYVLYLVSFDFQDISLWSGERRNLLDHMVVIKP